MNTHNLSYRANIITFLYSCMLIYSNAVFYNYIFQGPEYLVQWSGYSLTECSWEPENNLPRYLVDNFYQPPVDESRVKVFSRHFEDAIQRRLCSRNNKVVIQFDCDVYRYMFGDNESGIFFQEHFSKLFLTDSWCKFLRPSGTGKQITFPIRLQSKLRLRKVFIKNDEGKLEARHYPCEKLIILAGVESYSM